MTKKEQTEREELQKHQYTASNYTIDQFIFRHVFQGIMPASSVMYYTLGREYWKVDKDQDLAVRADLAGDIMDRLTDEEVDGLKKAYARLKEGDVDWYEDLPELKHYYKDREFMLAFFIDRGVISPNQGLEVEPSDHEYEYEDWDNFEPYKLAEALDKEEQDHAEAWKEGKEWWKDLPVVYKPKAKKTKKAVVETPSKESVKTPTEPVVEAPKEPQEAPKETAQPSQGIVIPSVAKMPLDKPSYAELERRCEEQEAEIERLRGLLAQVKANAQAIMDLV